MLLLLGEMSHTLEIKRITGTQHKVEKDGGVGQVVRRKMGAQKPTEHKITTLKASTYQKGPGQEWNSLPS